MNKKYCRILHDGKPTWGQLEGDKISIIDGDLLGSHTVTAKTIAASGAIPRRYVSSTSLQCVNGATEIRAPPNRQSFDVAVGSPVISA